MTEDKKGDAHIVDPQSWVNLDNEDRGARILSNEMHAEQARSAAEINRWQGSRCTEEFTAYQDRTILAKELLVAMIGNPNETRDVLEVTRIAVVMADLMLGIIGPRPPVYVPEVPKREGER